MSSPFSGDETRPAISRADRLLLTATSRFLPRPRWPSFFVTPTTLLREGQEAFRFVIRDRDQKFTDGFGAPGQTGRFQRQSNFLRRKLNGVAPWRGTDASAIIWFSKGSLTLDE